MTTTTSREQAFLECAFNGWTILSSASATAGFHISTPTPFVMVIEVRRRTTGSGALRKDSIEQTTDRVVPFKLSISRNNSSVFESAGYRLGTSYSDSSLSFVPDPVVSGLEVATIELGSFSGDSNIVGKYTESMDSLFDLNEDGGFDQADVDWLGSHFRAIGPEENPHTVKGNFVIGYLADPPESEAVDQADVDFLSARLADFGPSLRAGDVNGDGVLDCQDSYGALAFFESQIGDSDYVYSLDMNRDGIVDQSDKIAFFGLVNQCDFNQDGSVDDGDFVIFTAAYNILDCADPLMPAYCPADLNLDGVVDDADFSIFYVRYNAVTC